MYRSLGSSNLVTCATHTSFPSVGKCSRCQTHICAQCSAFVDLKPLCSSCARGTYQQKSRFLARARTLGAVAAAAVLVTGISLASHWRKDPYHWGTHEKTIKTLVKMLHETPCAPEKLRWLVWELRAADDNERAGTYLDEVLDHCQLPADVHRLAYQVHLANRDFEAATRDASRRILIDKTDRQAHLDRAFAYLASRKQDLAMMDDVAASKLASR
jgi:hypothetical protein